MKQIFTLLFAVVCSNTLFAQHALKVVDAQAHNQMVNSLLGLNQQPAVAMKTTAGILKQRVIGQSTRDHSTGSLSDSVRTRYTGMRASTYDFNSMIYGYNYPYSTSPMFNYAGTFTTPQVLCDTYVHWTINPFTMPAFSLYEGAISVFDTNNNLKSYRKLFVDSVTNDNVSYVNTFTTTKKINTGFWFNLNLGIADSAFKQYFAYNTSDKVIKDSIYELHLGTWRIAARTNYTYDGAGNLTQIDHFSNMTDTSFLLPLVQQAKYVNTYDASNRLKTVLTSFHNGTVLAAYVRDTFDYSGTLTYHNSWKQHQYDPINSVWTPQYYMSKHITAAKPDTVYHNGWNNVILNWEPISRDIMTYNTFDNPAKKVNYEWNWTSYSTTPDYTTTYYYDTFTYIEPTTGTVAAPQNQVNVYPNPGTNMLTVSMPHATGNQFLTLSVMNVNGQVISRESMRSKATMQVPVDYLVPGTYWLMIQDATGAALHRKQFVKQ